MFKRKDHFYKKAKQEGYASRAAYKLIEIQQKYKLLKPGDFVLELGAAPGGWLKIAAQTIGPKGHVLGIDRLPLKIPLPNNARFIQQNIDELKCAEPFDKAQGRPFDVILSDLSPDLSGIAFRDTYQSYKLAEKVWKIAKQALKKGGNLALKIFPSEESKQLAADLKKSFQSLKTLVPEATRKQSSEVYFVALGFKL